MFKTLDRSPNRTLHAKSFQNFSLKKTSKLLENPKSTNQIENPNPIRQQFSKDNNFARKARPYELILSENAHLYVFSTNWKAKGARKRKRCVRR